MFRLEGKVALVTGAARGIGAAIAELMAEEGAEVVIADVLDREGQALAARIGPAAMYVHLDVTKPAQWESGVEAAVRQLGRVHVLVNNAGIATYGTIEDHSLAAWERTLAVNLTGVFNGIKALIPVFKGAGGGSIVNISSAAGILAHVGMPAYVATKFGVRGLTKAAALELAGYGIRVNSVHPGIIRTPLSETGPQPDTDLIPLQRVGEPREVANLVAFLASEESSFSTGAEFIIDGGHTAGYTLVR